MSDQTDQIAAEAHDKIYEHLTANVYKRQSWDRVFVTAIIKTAIEKAVELEMTRVDIDSQSWGGIKLEWRPNEHRLYAYSSTGDFLFSGSPAYLIWRCIRESRAAHASEPLLQKCLNYLIDMRVDGVNQPQLEALITELRAAYASKPKCANCGKPATCFGRYENCPEGYACDDCCGHGNEDGHCEPIKPAHASEDEWFDDSPAAKKPDSPLVENYLRMFVQDILHGDEVHRAWLLEAVDCFIEGKHIPEPRQKPAPASDSASVGKGLDNKRPWTEGKLYKWSEICGHFEEVQPRDCGEDTKRLDFLEVTDEWEMDRRYKFVQFNSSDTANGPRMQTVREAIDTAMQAKEKDKARREKENREWLERKPDSDSVGKLEDHVEHTVYITDEDGFVALKCCDERHKGQIVTLAETPSSGGKWTEKFVREILKGKGADGLAELHNATLPRDCGEERKLLYRIGRRIMECKATNEPLNIELIGSEINELLYPTKSPQRFA